MVLHVSARRFVRGSVERFCQISVRSCITVLSLCRLKSERQEPNHYLKRGEKDSIKAHGGSPTKRSPQPPKAGAYAARSNPPNTAFRRFYERGDLPIAVEHRGMKNVISWKVCQSYAVSMAWNLQRMQWSSCQWKSDSMSCNIAGIITCVVFFWGGGGGVGLGIQWVCQREEWHIAVDTRQLQNKLSSCEAYRTESEIVPITAHQAGMAYTPL